jgi:hypothetical protein
MLIIMISTVYHGISAHPVFPDGPFRNTDGRKRQHSLEYDQEIPNFKQHEAKLVTYRNRVSS